MEAHSGLSAKIVAEQGFEGIWASGLSISASLGVRDSNEASWTQVLDVLEYMSDAAPDAPILVDADTGYGNFNNARRLVRKLEQRGVAGVCIEDKLFPKTNSLLSNVAQPLAEVDEFAGKIRAMKATQQDPNFSVVARVEALIAGWPVEEALRRSHAYVDAGADAILMHSKRADCSEIDAFMEAWDHSRAPVVIVPTNYHETPTQHFADIGVSFIIWANHNLRASIAAMQETTRTIYERQSLVDIEPRVVPVSEVFRLQDQQELSAAEKLYLPQKE
jgi:phosphoenolpyruvate phosphomutase